MLAYSEHIGVYIEKMINRAGTDKRQNREENSDRYWELRVKHETKKHYFWLT